MEGADNFDIAMEPSVLRTLGRIARIWPFDSPTASEIAAAWCDLFPSLPSEQVLLRGNILDARIHAARSRRLTYWRRSGADVPEILVELYTSANRASVTHTSRPNDAGQP